MYKTKRCKFKFFLLILAAVIAIFSFTSCSYKPSDFYNITMYDIEKDETEQNLHNDTTDNKTLTFPYDNSDVLNPYLTKTQVNQNLKTLLYDSLVTLTPDYKTEQKLAQSIKISETTVTIKLKTNVLFSDNSPLTAENVISTMQFAFENSQDFSKKLHNVKKYTALDDYTIEIILNTPDIFFEKLLTFPIIKYDENNLSNPIGSGMYTFSSENNYSLKANLNHRFLDEFNIKTINLTTLPDTKAYMYGIKLGTVSYYYNDLANQEDMNVGAGSTLVDTNNLVYLGFNQESELFELDNIPKAISLALNRPSIASVAYSTKATPTNHPINPAFLKSQDIELLTEQNINQAIRILENNGLTDIDNSKFRLNENMRIMLDLLVNSDNPSRINMANEIKNNLWSLGILVNVVSIPFDDYQKAISNGDFDLYIGEVKIADNMDISFLINSQANTKFGLDKNDQLITSNLKFRSGETSVQQFLSEFERYMTFIPLAFRKSYAMFDRNLKNNIICTENDVYYNIQDWFFA